MGKLADYNINEVAGAISLILGGLGGLLLIIFKSRCSQISCCWGLWSCIRVLPPDDSDDDEEKQKKDKPKPKPVLNPRTTPSV